MRGLSRSLAPLIVALLAGCTTLPPASPTPQPGPSDEPIVIALPLPPFGSPPFLWATNATPFRFSIHPELASRMVHSALYRFDDSLSPVPDLAAEPCAIAEDGVTITCELVEATFHDGSTLTADDVAFTYELGRRARIGGDCLFVFGYCYDQTLESVTAIDPRTVQFRLSRPDATFLTVVMPDVLIDSRRVVEAAYAPLAERGPTLDAGEYEAAAAAIAEQLDAEDPDCAGTLPRAEELLAAAGIEPLPREQFERADGTFNECMYAELTAHTMLAPVAGSLRASGLDAIALAYPALSFNRAPVGTGPFRWVGVVDGTRLRLEANPAYHHGPPAAAAVEIRITRDLAAAQQALLDGEIHWLPIPGVFPEVYEELRTDPDLRFAQFPDTGFFHLMYNLREGMLFADPNLRSALELCIDKPATVDAATEGTGDPIYSFVPPVSWAYDPDLPRPARDVAAARQLIEASGWTVGEDGVYTRDGERLSTEVFVTAEDTQRLAFMVLTAEQARDCGFDLVVIPADSETVLRPFDRYPHVVGGRDEPFEAHFISWISNSGYDPHDTLFHSSRITSDEQPVADNFMGFRNERVDELLDAGLATYDQRERARIYRELQEIIAAEKPVLFAWAARVYDAIDARLGYVDGDINLGSPQWFWRLEDLVLRDDAQR